MKIPRLLNLVTFNLLLIGNLIAQEYNINGQQSSTFPSIFNPTSLLTDTSQTCTWDSLRFLGEINRPTLPEAYPWLSADGFRLYYTEGTPDSGLRDSIYMVERPSLDDPFGTPQLLNINNNGRSNISCWLTNDELEMYFMIRDDISINVLALFYVDRPSMNDNFSEPKPISLINAEPGFYSGPSLTPDQSQLFIYTTVNSSTGSINAYNRVDDSTFSFAYTFPNPDNLRHAPGQLSKDGLRFYHAIENEFHYWERMDVSAPFEEPAIPLQGAINTFINLVSQPTLNGDGNRIIFVGSKIFSFIATDFYESIKSDVLISTDDLTFVGASAIQLFPNPASTTLHVKDQSGLFREMHVFDLLGKELSHQAFPMNASPLAIDIQNLVDGVYFAQFRSSNGVILTRKFVVKK